MFSEPPVRRSGENVWRPPVGVLIMSVGLGAAALLLTYWLYSTGEPLSLRDRIVFPACDLMAVVLVPVAVLRWRVVLEPDELIFVFLRVRRLALREIVDARCVANRGLVFVCRDGSEEATELLGNSFRGHRRVRPTRSDLAARTVLCAAARLRGESPPYDFRLGPIAGRKEAMIEGGIWALIVGIFLG